MGIFLPRYLWLLYFVAYTLAPVRGRKICDVILFLKGGGGEIHYIIPPRWRHGLSYASAAPLISASVNFTKQN